MKYFTGVGSRKTSQNILDLMRIMAHIFETKGFILRSGGADGADSAFESGITNPANKQIYYANQATPEAMEIASRFHPVWNKYRMDGSPIVSDYAKKLHGRNAFQVLGFNLNEPSDLLVCWTPDGCTQHIGRSIQTGGTGTAISIAEAYGVKVANLQRPDHYQQAVDWVKRNYSK